MVPWVTWISCCPCGDWHRVCRACYLRWELGPRVGAIEWPAGALLEVCPRTDEFAVARELAER